MDISPGALLLIAFGIFDIGAGLWAYLGPPEDHGAPRGFKSMGKTWHGRGSVCAALPAGIFFLCLGLAAVVADDTLRRAFVYVAILAVVAATLFLFRAPAAVRPAWLRDKP